MNPQPLRQPARDDGWSSESDVRERRFVSREVCVSRHGDDAPASEDARVCEDARVRAIVDVPEYEVCRGEIGIVCSTWNLPSRLIEVEFACVLSGEIKRALLNPDQIELHDEAATDDVKTHDPELPDACDETEDELQPA